MVDNESKQLTLVTNQQYMGMEDDKGLSSTFSKITFLTKRMYNFIFLDRNMAWWSHHFLIHLEEDESLSSFFSFASF